MRSKRLVYELEKNVHMVTVYLLFSLFLCARFLTLILNNLSLFGANKSSVTNNFRFISFFIFNFLFFCCCSTSATTAVFFRNRSVVSPLCGPFCVCMFFFNSLSSHCCLLRCIFRGIWLWWLGAGWKLGSPKPNITWKREGPTANHPAGKFCVCNALF